MKERKKKKERKNELQHPRMNVSPGGGQTFVLQ